jgi:integrase
MGHITKTPAGTFRANWRDLSGRQRAKTFATKREAASFLAEIRTALNRGAYVDPRAGKAKFGPYALRWLASRSVERTTSDKDRSVMHNHVLPRWGEIPLAAIDHSAVQAWVGSLGARLAPATIGQCYRMTSNVLRSAVRDRLVGFNPCDDIRLPRPRKHDSDDRVITLAELTRLLAVVPDRYRALVALSAGTGLRWGECLGMRWDCIDLDAMTVQVIRVATEVNGHVFAKPYPKSRAGRRAVPIPPFLASLLAAHRERYPAGPAGEVFTNTAGGPLRRSMFRTRIWRPALVRAGLLGAITEHETRFRAEWLDQQAHSQTREFDRYDEAVAHVSRNAHGGVRFHDLRHSYATWLVSGGVPINDVQKAMGHEKASTTLDLYTHDSDAAESRLRKPFADFSLTDEPIDPDEDEDKAS